MGENELAIVKEISNNPKITIAELSQKIGISTTTIGNNIAKLKKKVFCREDWTR
ncbi:MAG: winged helix-turn-helix domain-containing protein [Methanosarcina sp.]